MKTITDLLNELLKRDDISDELKALMYLRLKDLEEKLVKDLKLTSISYQAPR